MDLKKSTREHWIKVLNFDGKVILDSAKTIKKRLEWIAESMVKEAIEGSLGRDIKSAKTWIESIENDVKKIKSDVAFIESIDAVDWNYANGD